MADEEIVQNIKIEVEGGAQAADEFKKIGDSAEEAFNKLSKDADQVSAATEKVVNNVVKLGQTFKSGFGQGIGSVFGPLVEQVNKLSGGTFSKLGQSITSIGRSFSGLRTAVSGIAPAFAVIRTNFLAAEAAGRGTLAGTEALAASFAALGPSVGAVGIALGALAATSTAVGAALFGLASSASSAAAAVKEAAISTGVGVEELQKLRFAAEQSGASAEKLERAFFLINAATQTAIDAGKRSSGVFEKLGIDLVDSSGHARSAADVFLDLADKVEKLKNPADQAALAAKALGVRLGPGLTETLSLGRAGIVALGADLTGLGGVITETQTKVGKEFTDALGRLGAALTGLKNQVGLVFSPGFTTQIDNFTAAIAAIAPTVIAVASSVRDNLAAAFSFLGELLAPVIAVLQEIIGWAKKLLDAFNELFGTNITGTQIAGFIIALGILATAFAAILLVVGLVVGAFAALTGAIASAVVGGAAIIAWAVVVGLALGTLAELVRNFTWEEFVALATSAWQSVVNVVSGAVESVVSFLASLPGRVVNVWNNIVQVAQAAWNSIVAGAQSLPGRIVNVFNSLLTALAGLGARIAQALSSAWDEMVRAANEAVDKAIAAIGRLLARIAEAALKLVGLGSSAGASEGGAFAQGGRVYGSGTGTSDSIPAWLSHGEWVIRAAAVRKYGHALFAMLNNMRIPANHIKQLLANGGFVPTMLPGRASPLHFAQGGSVDSPATMRTLNLTILGENFTGLLAPDDVAERLERFAVNRQVKSAGRKPGYYRG